VTHSDSTREKEALKKSSKKKFQRSKSTF
jgi:hypothetical protein